MPIIGRATDWRVDLQPMWFAELLQPGVQFFAGVARIIVFSMDEKHRHTNAWDCIAKPAPQFRRSIGSRAKGLGGGAELLYWNATP